MEFLTEVHESSQYTNRRSSLLWSKCSVPCKERTVMPAQELPVAFLFFPWAHDDDQSVNQFGRALPTSTHTAGEYHSIKLDQRSRDQSVSVLQIGMRYIDTRSAHTNTDSPLHYRPTERRFLFFIERWICLTVRDIPAFPPLLTQHEGIRTRGGHSSI
jgi:hypothetical protein